MKVFSTILLLFFSLFVTTCSKSDTFVNSLKQNPPQQILEITNDFSGLYWMNGQVLAFRLFDDNTAEYDEYPLTKTQYDTVQAEWVKKTKQIKITDEEFQEITNLLTNNEISKIEKDINPNRSCIDAFINTEIDFNYENVVKHISIKNNCSTLANPKSTIYLFDNFPSSINTLFEILTKIKDKESAGKFYN